MMNHVPSNRSNYSKYLAIFHEDDNSHFFLRSLNIINKVRWQAPWIISYHSAKKSLILDTSSRDLPNLLTYTTVPAKNMYIQYIHYTSRQSVHS
jgi:hypothetical protein